MRLVLVVLIACDAGVPAKPPPKPVHVDPPLALDYAECPERSLETPNDADVLATLRRHACYGKCPVYQVVVYRTGLVVYTGAEWVGHCDAINHLDDNQLGQLRGIFAASEFFALADKYLHESWTDDSTVDISYQPAAGRRKLVEHYHGDANAPERLTALEEAFDRVVRTDRWVRIAPRE